MSRALRYGQAILAQQLTDAHQAQVVDTVFNFITASASRAADIAIAEADERDEIKRLAELAEKGERI